MYTYYFRSPNQDELGRIIVEVVRKSLYYFKGFFNNCELNLLQARPGKEILPPIDVAKSCQKLVAQVYGDYTSLTIFCVGFQRIQDCISIYKENQNFIMETLVLPYNISA